MGLSAKQHSSRSCLRRPRRTSRQADSRGVATFPRSASAPATPHWPTPSTSTSRSSSSWPEPATSRRWCGRRRPGFDGLFFGTRAALGRVKHCPAWVVGVRQHRFFERRDGRVDWAAGAAGRPVRRPRGLPCGSPGARERAGGHPAVRC